MSTRCGDIIMRTVMGHTTNTMYIQLLSSSLMWNRYNCLGHCVNHKHTLRIVLSPIVAEYNIVMRSLNYIRVTNTSQLKK